MEVGVGAHKRKIQAVAIVGVLDVEGAVRCEVAGSLHVVGNVAAGFHGEPLEDHQSILGPLLVKLLERRFPLRPCSAADSLRFAGTDLSITPFLCSKLQWVLLKARLKTSKK